MTQPTSPQKYKKRISICLICKRKKELPPNGKGLCGECIGTIPPPPQERELSACCQAEMKIEGGDEEIMFYRCLQCGETFDLMSTKIQKSLQTKQDVNKLSKNWGKVKIYGKLIDFETGKEEK